MSLGIGNVVEITEGRYIELRDEILEGSTRTHSGYMKSGKYVGAVHVGNTPDHLITNIHSHSDLNLPKLFKVVNKKSDEVSYFVGVK